MEKIKILAYWSGKQNERISRVFKMIKDAGMDLIVNSDSDDKEMARESKYYRVKREEKQYAFMSDYWRIWYPANHHGKFLYFDATSDVNISNLKKFIKLCEDKDFIGFKDDKYAYSASFYYINTSSKYVDIFTNFLNFYNQHFNKKSYRSIKNNFMTVGNRFTRFLRPFLEKGDNGFHESEERNIMIMASYKVMNGEAGFLKYGLGSWKGNSSREIRPYTDSIVWREWSCKKTIGLYRKVEQFILFWILGYYGKRVIRKKDRK